MGSSLNQKKRKIKGAPLQDLSHSLRKVDYLLIRLNPSLLSLDNKPGEHFSNSSSIAVRHALRSTGTCELHVYRTRFSLISQKSRGCFQLLSAACFVTSCAASCKASRAASCVQLAVHASGWASGVASCVACAGNCSLSNGASGAANYARSSAVSGEASSAVDLHSRALPPVCFCSRSVHACTVSMS